MESITHFRVEVTLAVKRITAEKLAQISREVPTSMNRSYDATASLLHLSFIARARDPFAAMNHVQEALKSAHKTLGECSVVALRVHPVGNDPVKLDLVGYAEIAKMSRPVRSRQWARQLAERDRSFPRSVGLTGSGPVFSRENVVAYLARKGVM